ncbi:proline-rich nuclear receptor coactivator 2-like [Microplitis mediator]|uniref:proline-rich nuclear receptor coactivator 2-like n=1 Tax=Microplitis mediator TaxID=375433 RepID=UPI002554B723|nr:proline-rich nuclear receptor coactivator 2-like [Microplitis mediator]XP_057341485.1 proline-rich nuclear receptor coactivator 2-like [Microplitis mediator]XP_057341486.1 proline-rich nuclear receptor coactivator 2-like [Microplitis mediator]
MTNSTPKMNNKVERQASPSSSAKKRSRGTPRSTYFNNNKYSNSTTPNHNNNNINNTNINNSITTGRLSFSPCGKNHSYYSRSNDSSGYSTSSSLSSRSSGNGSPTNNYFAGSKWSDPPSAAALPQPPSHWTPIQCQQLHDNLLSNHLKVILNVQA